VNAGYSNKPRGRRLLTGSGLDTWDLEMRVAITGASRKPSSDRV